jgi:hypothetical protein
MDGYRQAAKQRFGGPGEVANRVHLKRALRVAASPPALSSCAPISDSSSRKLKARLARDLEIIHRLAWGRSQRAKARLGCLLHGAGLRYFFPNTFVLSCNASSLERISSKVKGLVGNISTIR